MRKSNHIEEEKDEIRKHINNASKLISKLLEDDFITNSDKFFLRDVRVELKDISTKLKLKSFPELSKYDINKINKYAKMRNLYLLNNN